MGQEDKLVKICKFNFRINDILGINVGTFDIYQSKGLKTHLLKRKHFVALKYIDLLPTMIYKPDYIGVREDGFEMVKCYNDNIMIVVKLDCKNHKYFVATLYDISRSKLEKYVTMGRLVKIDLT